MTANIDRVRELCDQANVSRSTNVAVGLLVLALEALCDELEGR